MAKFIIFLSSIASVAAFSFIGTPSSTLCRQAVHSRSRCAIRMGGDGGASTMEHKVAKVSRVKSLLETSQMIFSVPGSSVTVKEVQNLRRALPDTTTVSIVKNKLMARALEGTDFDVASGTLLKGSNMWFFIEEDIGSSIKVFQDFVKENNKKDTHFPLGGVIEGDLLDSAGVIAVSKLPSKKELYAKIAGSIKQVPTKLARVVKATPTKLARAIKLATEKNDE